MSQTQKFSRRLSRRAFLQIVGGSASTLALASCMPAMPPTMTDMETDDNTGTDMPNTDMPMDVSTMQEVSMMGEMLPVRRSVSSLSSKR